MVEVIEGARVPVHSWAPDLEEGARQQALNCASLPVAYRHVAVMADGHQGYGVPIGAVVALESAISPYAVGNDIGCGMAIVPTTLTKEDILGTLPTRSGAPGPVARDEIMGWVQSTIPSGNGAHRDPAIDPHIQGLLDAAFDAMTEAASISGVPLSTSQSIRADAGRPLDSSDFGARGHAQLGTLGSGNHFIELLVGPDDDVWVMLHSGSRGVGGAICNNFHRMALAHCEAAREELPDPGLAWLPIDGTESRWARVGRCYERALRAGLDYAEHNRRHMLGQVADIVERRFPNAFGWEDIVNIHHNDATLERHFGADVWVHRKGAVKASAGTATVTPGSMGTATVLGNGLGNPDSFESCSHGAGRTRSRGKARQELSLERELATINSAGGKVFATSKEAVLDEMPGAYKDLDAVMQHQSDLVEAVRRFTPLGTYKGSESPRRKGKTKGKDKRPDSDRAQTWRPEEER